MPSHGTCFIGAGMAWSFIAIFAQQSPVAICAASIQTWRHKLRRLHRLSRRPNEEGKSGKDNEQAPEDQDQHACNIRRSLTPFKTAPVAATVVVQTFGINVTKRRELDSAHAARTAFQISGALLSLMRSFPSLN